MEERIDAIGGSETGVDSRIRTAVAIADAGLRETIEANGGVVVYRDGTTTYPNNHNPLQESLDTRQ